MLKNVPRLLGLLIDWTPPKGVQCNIAVKPGGRPTHVILTTREANCVVEIDPKARHAGRLYAYLDAQAKATLATDCDCPRCRTRRRLEAAGEAFEDAISRVAVPDNDCDSDPIGGGR